MKDCRKEGKYRKILDSCQYIRMHICVLITHVPPKNFLEVNFQKQRITHQAHRLKTYRVSNKNVIL